MASNKHVDLRKIKDVVRNRKAAAQRCSVKKMFLKFRKIHRKKPVSESLF